VAELTNSCVKPARGPIMPDTGSTGTSSPMLVKEESHVQVQVGQEAIDFEAGAFFTGQGFKPVRLRDYIGRWIVLCFYPGDFTFV